MQFGGEHLVCLELALFISTICRKHNRVRALPSASVATPSEPTANLTIYQVNSQGVTIDMDGTSINGSIYGTFYYGSLGIPAETVFSQQTFIERDSYIISYAAFVSGLSSPSVYLNSTGGYIEWRMPATINPQEIYFTNTPTHTTIIQTTTQTESDCLSHPLTFIFCALNLFNNNIIVQTMGTIVIICAFVVLVIGLNVLLRGKKNFKQDGTSEKAA